MHDHDLRGGVSLQKAGDAARSAPTYEESSHGASVVAVADPGPAASLTGASATRHPRSRRLRVALPVLGVLLAAVVGLARFAHVVDEVASGVAGALPGTTAVDGTGRSGAVVPAPGRAPSSAAHADAVPAAAPLSAMLLTADLLPGGLELDADAVPRDVGLDEYRAAYVQRMTPSSCARAKGLMAFQGDGEGVVRRADDLRSTGATGSQQVRRFASTAAARAFLDEQRSWFADCGRSTYRWPAASAEFVGAIDADDGDELLTSALVVRSGTARAPEFDGWVRRGDVVFGAYLSGAPGTERSVLRAAGRALLDRGKQHLAALR